MENIINLRKFAIVLIALVSILLLSSCAKTLVEKEEKVDTPQSIIEHQTDWGVEINNKEVVVLSSITGDKVTFEYRNLKRNYDVESSVDFFIRGNKSKFSSTYYGAYEKGEVFFEINKLLSNKVEMNVLNAKGIYSDIDFTDLKRSIYYKEIEHEIIDDKELVLGAIIFSEEESSLGQDDEIIFGNMELDDIITKENYVFILKSRFKSNDEKK